MEKHLHIICLTVPYPVNYGGIFDLFYKIVSLHKHGIKIHLHCFQYGREEQAILKEYCETVQYYPRKSLLEALPISTPYIVSSRNNLLLTNNLLQNNYPILMEGVHCTFLLKDKRFVGRQCIVRLHNVEHIYYDFLHKYSTSFFKKLYFKWESNLLKKYEKSISRLASFITVSEFDANVYRHFGATKVTCLPLFLPDWKVLQSEGKGSFCLYHGDLSVPENEKAVIWLIEEVFSKIDIPFVSAGKNPTNRLKDLIHSYQNTCLIENPSDAEMNDLIAKSHINIIPSYNQTGIKLKLINSLYNGRHCLVNTATISGTGLEECCQLAETADEFIEAIEYIYPKPFTKHQIDIRQQLLTSMFNNDTNAEELIKLIWHH